MAYNDKKLVESMEIAPKLLQNPCISTQIPHFWEMTN